MCGVVIFHIPSNIKSSIMVCVILYHARCLECAPVHHDLPRISEDTVVKPTVKIKSVRFLSSEENIPFPQSNVWLEDALKFPFKDELFVSQSVLPTIRSNDFLTENCQWKIEFLLTSGIGSFILALIHLIGLQSGYILSEVLHIFDITLSREAHYGNTQIDKVAQWKFTGISLKTSPYDNGYRQEKNGKHQCICDMEITSAASCSKQTAYVQLTANSNSREYDHKNDYIYHRDSPMLKVLKTQPNLRNPSLCSCEPFHLKELRAYNLSASKLMYKEQDLLLLSIIGLLNTNSCRVTVDGFWSKMTMSEELESRELNMIWYSSFPPSNIKIIGFSSLLQRFHSVINMHTLYRVFQKNVCNRLPRRRPRRRCCTLGMIHLLGQHTRILDWQSIHKDISSLSTCLITDNVLCIQRSLTSPYVKEVQILYDGFWMNMSNVFTNISVPIDLTTFSESDNEMCYQEITFFEGNNFISQYTFRQILPSIFISYQFDESPFMPVTDPEGQRNIWNRNIISCNSQSSFIVIFLLLYILAPTKFDLSYLSMFFLLSVGVCCAMLEKIHWESLKKTEDNNPSIQSCKKCRKRIRKGQTSPRSKSCKDKSSVKEFQRQFYEFYVKWTKVFDLEKRFGVSHQTESLKSKTLSKKRLSGGKKRKYAYKKSGPIVFGKVKSVVKPNKRLCPLRYAFKIFIKQRNGDKKITLSQTTVKNTDKCKASGGLNEIKKMLFSFRGIPNRPFVAYPVFNGTKGSPSSSYLNQSDMSLQTEILRFETFKNFPITAEVSAILLAKWGFVYTGKSDIVECFHCHVQYQGWKKGDNAFDIHRRISPTCGFILGYDARNERLHHNDSRKISSLTASANTRGLIIGQSIDGTEMSSISGGFSYQCTEDNPSDFTNHSHADEHAILASFSLPNRINSAQFNESDHVTRKSTCISTDAVTEDEAQSLEKQKNGHKPQCSFQKIVELEPLEVSNRRPKYQSFSVMTVRMSSFKGWTASTGQTPKDLAEAGFLYAGFGDRVMCYSCGGELQNWEPLDDPWVEHSKWFPHCYFLRMTKGDAFVRLVQERNGVHVMIKVNENRQVHRSDEQKIVRSSVSYSDPDIAARRVREMGYTWETINEAMDKLKKSGKQIEPSNIVDEISSTGVSNSFSADNYAPFSKHSNCTDKDSAEINTAMQHLDIRDKKSLLEEKRHLEKRRLCKICLEDNASLTFIPCGHLACCENCGLAVRKCPVCRQPIHAHVKTWIA